MADDLSVSTPKAGANAAAKDNKMAEITVRFTFEPMTKDASSKVAAVHTHLLAAMQKAFDDDCLIFDNKAKQLPIIDTIEFSPVNHQSHFTIHTDNGSKTRKLQYHIIHRIRTSQSLSTIKTYNTIASLLQQHSCYLRPHQWDETVWDVAHTGYLIGIDPKHHTPEVASHLVSDLMSKKGLTKCPPLRMIFSTPRITVDGNTTRTKAYAIQFERKNAKQVLRCLKEAFANTTQFLLAKLKHTHPVSFANALKIQNKTMRDTYVLPMLNISHDEFFYLQNEIQPTPGVMSIVPTRQTTTHGRYDILIQSKQFKTARADITAKFATYYAAIPTDAQQNPDAYDFYGPPRIHTATDQEDSSSGDQSFLSLSAASFGSCDISEMEDTFDTARSSTNYSWSQVVQQNPSVPKEVTTPASSATNTTATSVLTPSVPPTPTDEIATLRAEYELQMANTATELAEMKSMLTQLLYHLNLTSAQQAPESEQEPSSTPNPPPEAMDTTDASDAGSQLKRSGHTTPTSPPKELPRKRTDTKSTPIRQDFHRDE